MPSPPTCRMPSSWAPWETTSLVADCLHLITAASLSWEQWWELENAWGGPGQCAREIPGTSQSPPLGTVPSCDKWAVKSELGGSHRQALLCC